MAHFYGSMQGSRGEATRCGTKSSGMYSHARGWSIGGSVNVYQGYAVEDAVEDAVEFRITSGSNQSSRSYLIGTFTRADLDRLIDGSLKLTLSEADPKVGAKCKFCDEPMTNGRGDFCTRTCRHQYEIEFS